MNTPPQPNAHRGGGHAARIILLGLSTLLLTFVTFCYAIRPDGCAAVTLFPAATWLAPGLLLVFTGTSRPTRRAALAATLAWLAFLLWFAEEPKSLLRTLRPVSPAPPGARTIRVVSLNCAGGSAEAADEVARFRPDLVLLQESPGRQEAEALARRLFGDAAGVAWGVDASILARGTVTAAPLPRDLAAYFVQARVRLAGNAADRELEVVSLRLNPPLFRLDVWNPDNWRAQAEDRRRRRAQLRALVARLPADTSAVPVVLGGDFNAPQGDAVYRLLEARNLFDPFAHAGRGWGNTAINDVPLVRIDQVWATRAHFEARNVRAYPTTYSDHRIVVCDLVQQP